MATSFNPCQKFSEDLERQISKLEEMGTGLKDQVSSIQSSLGSITDGQLTDDLSEAFDSMASSIVDIGKSSEVSKFTGSCLNDVIDSASNFVKSLDFSEVIEDSISSLSEGTTSLALESYKSSIENLKISKIMNKLDTKIGCMSDQLDISSCIDLVDGFQDRINTVVSDLGLQDDGSFELLGFIDSLGSPVDPKIIQSLKSISDEADMNKVTAITDVQANIPEVSAPSLPSMKDILKKI